MIKQEDNSNQEALINWMMKDFFPFQILKLRPRDFSMTLFVIFGYFVTWIVLIESRV